MYDYNIYVEYVFLFRVFLYDLLIINFIGLFVDRFSSGFHGGADDS